ncbi:fatty acid desaturase [Echinicola jeungdonensis]|uniref:Fatty acid desaturase n=1 Tax=Echinicola jeungdonensis TaxID=709343 RepID=A0ABV5J8J8_9BACT|nr:fatty acid desaturase [Echinicola jeungdonensis]MDN3669234.1 fatty acid desaturase [Echinicola jeungdonensis]
MSQNEKTKNNVDPIGTLFAFGIISLWGLMLYLLLNLEMDFANPLMYLGFLLQTHLYTGLFITAHDAMHGSVSKNSKLNHAIGWLAALLFSFNFYNRIFPKHHQHHQFVATGNDPDFHSSGQFWKWYWNFIKTYISIGQLILMAIAFQLLIIFFPIENLVAFWILPAILATFQLFYFGTYLPHRGSHNNKHQSRTLAKNHFWAFLSCYFFGYHYEHHDSPGTPWWGLWRVKEKKYLGESGEN